MMPMQTFQDDRRLIAGCCGAGDAVTERLQRRRPVLMQPGRRFCSSRRSEIDANFACMRLRLIKV